MDSRYISFAALAVGVLSVILAFLLFYMPYVPLIMGIIGIVLSNVANKVEKNAMATAGFVMSVIATAVSAFFFIVVIMFVTCVDTMAFSDLSQYESIPDLFKGFKDLA